MSSNVEIVNDSINNANANNHVENNNMFGSFSKELSSVLNPRTLTMVALSALAGVAVVKKFGGNLALFGAVFTTAIFLAAKIAQKISPGCASTVVFISLIGNVGREVLGFPWASLKEKCTFLATAAIKATAPIFILNIAFGFEGLSNALIANWTSIAITLVGFEGGKIIGGAIGSSFEGAVGGLILGAAFGVLLKISKPDFKRLFFGGFSAPAELE
jgi:hypothetical protein